MKRFLLLLLTMIVLFGCSSGSGGSDPSDIEPAEQLSAKDVAASGADPEKAPANAAATIGLLNSVGSLTDDPVVTELKMLMSFVKKPVPTSIHALTSAKAMPISNGLDEQLLAAKESFAKLWTEKKASATLSASNEAIGTYITLVSGSLNVNAVAESTDGGPVKWVEDEDGDGAVPVNLKSISGDARLSLAIDSKELPASCIKGFKVRLNAGGEASATANASGSGNASFDFAESLSLALSLADAEGVGGIIVLTADAKNSGTINSDTIDPNDPSSFASLVPSMAITLAVYKDDGSLAFPKQSYSDLAAFLAAIGFDEPEKI